MPKHNAEMSIGSTIVWVVVAFAASAATLVSIWGFAPTVVALGTVPWPIAG
jgi:hypothetical protein